MHKLKYVLSAQEEDYTVDPNIKPADKFEKRIKDLFRLLGFQKVNGGPRFKIGDNQIDACGICEDKLIIAECTTQRKDIKAKIAQFKGIQSSIKKGLSGLTDYKEFLTKDGVIFILIINNDINFDQYSKLNNDSNFISYWGLSKIKYYESIAKNVKNRARFDILADLGCQINNTKVIKIPAFKVCCNNVEMYSFFAEPNDLIKVSYVARRESGNSDYYQRMLEPKRLNKIREFLNKKGIFPTNIVLGIEGKAEFKKIKIDDQSYTDFPKWMEVGFLTLPKSYQGCWVIDGQHRLFSFEPGMNQKISVLALSNISFNKQTEFFVKINKEAKPIKSNLIWDLQGDLSATSQDGIISNAVKKLNILSTFKDKISMPSHTSGSITITTFCESLKKAGFPEKTIKTVYNNNTHTKNPFYNDDPVKHSLNIANSIEDYYAIIQCYINDKNEYINDFIFANGGVSVFIQLYKIIICVEGKKINEDLAEAYIGPIIDFISSKGSNGIKDYKIRCSSEAGKNDIVQELLEVVKDNSPLINEYLKKNTSLNILFPDFELKIRNFIIKKLIDENFENVKNNLNNEMIKKIEQKIKITNYSLKDFCDCLTLGDSKAIILDCKY